MSLDFINRKDWKPSPHVQILILPGFCTASRSLLSNELMHCVSLVAMCFDIGSSNFAACRVPQIDTCIRSIPIHAFTIMRWKDTKQAMTTRSTTHVTSLPVQYLSNGGLSAVHVNHHIVSVHICSLSNLLFLVARLNECNPREMPLLLPPHTVKL